MKRFKQLVGFIQPKAPYSLSQKINIVFGVFFLVGVVQTLIDQGLHYFLYSEIELVERIMGVVAILFLIVARFDNKVIRFTQIGLLIIISLVLVATQEAAWDLTAYILMSVTLAAAYKMRLFGEKGTLRFIVTVIVVTPVLIVRAGNLHGFTVPQQVLLISFVMAYFLLLYFIFEEETLVLQRRNEILTGDAEDMKPFVELGENVAGLVHDFKGDISGIYALSEIERLSGNNDTADKLMVYGERLSRRTEAVMYVATARDHFEVDTVDINTLLSSTVYYFVEINRDLKHKVDIKMQEMDFPSFRTRRSVLIVILENVIKNSIEATEGRPRRAIDISAERDGSTLRLEIENSGIPLPFTTKGKPVDVAKSLFFKRGRTTKEKGTGLGMTNVIRSLEILHGRMFMENTTTGVKNTIIIPEAD